MKNLFSIMLALLISGATFAQKQKLELNLIKGETYYQRSTMEMNMKQTVMDQEMNITMGMDAKMSYQVVNTVDTIYDIICKYENLSMKMELPTGNMEYKSGGTTDDNAFSKLMATMTKNSFDMKLSKSGKVIAVSGIDKLFAGIGDDSSPEMEAVKAQLSQSYGETAFKSNMEMSMAIYPNKPVQVGDQWIIKTSLQTGMQINVSNTYTLKEITDQYYIVSGNSVISPDGGTTEVNGMKMKSNMNGTMTSDLKISKNTGWIAEGVINQHIKGTNEILPNDQMQKGMSMPIDITTKINISNK